MTASQSQPRILCAPWFVPPLLNLRARALMLLITGLSIGFQRVLCFKINLLLMRLLRSAVLALQQRPHPWKEIRFTDEFK